MRTDITYTLQNVDASNITFAITEKRFTRLSVCIIPLTFTANRIPL